MKLANKQIHSISMSCCEYLVSLHFSRFVTDIDQVRCPV